MRALALIGLAAALLAVPAGGQPPVAPPVPKPLTPAQREKLKEARAHSQEATELEEAGNFKAAVAAAEKMLAAEREVYGNVHDDVAESLDRIGGMRVQLEDWAGARAAYQEQLEIRAALHGKGHWRVTDARLNLADAALFEKMGPADRAAVQKALIANAEGGRLFEQGKYADAERRFKDALADRRKALGDTHPSTLTSMNNLAGLYQKQARYADAERMFKDVMAGHREAFGDAHPSTLASKNNLAELYRVRGRYADAEPLLNDALAGYCKAFGDAHPLTLTSTNNLALLFQAQGRYADAERMFQGALAGRRKALGDAHPSTLNSMNNLALLYRTQARYTDAEPLFKSAIAGYRKAYGDTHPLTLNGMNNLALLYSSQARYADAEPIYKEALAGCREGLGNNHPDTLRSMNNLAALYIAQARYADAEPLYEDALAGHRKALGDAHPSTLLSMNNLARLHLAQGRYADAERLFEGTLAGRRKALGDAHPSTLLSMHNLAALYYDRGRFADAEPLLKEVLTGRRGALGDAHPDTLLCMSNLASLYRTQARSADAGPLYKEALTSTRALLERTATGQAEGHQLTFRASLRSRLDNYLSFGIVALTPAADRYTEVLAWKGAAFARRSQLRGAVEKADDPELKALFAGAGDVARRLASLASSVPPADQLPAYRKSLKDLSDRKDEIDQELARKSEPFRTARATAALTPDQLAKALPADVALVDYLDYTHSRPDPDNKGKALYERRLLAYVVRAGQPVAEVELGPAQPVTEAVDRWRATTGRTAPVRDDKDPAAILRQKVWDPVAKHLAGAKVVLVSPDGALGRLPFAALPGADPTKYLLEEVALVVAPVPQLVPELLATARAPVKNPALLLVGGVDYDAEPGAPGAADTARAADPTGTRAGAAGKWSPLPGTHSEAKAIRNLFGATFPSGTAAELDRGAATEAAVRQKAPASRFVHVATHGFFAPPKPDTAPKAGTRTDPEGAGFDRRGAAEVHPGLQSGLVLAGANRPPTPGADDGILTALEVADLDLSAVELAVLSACETRLGKEFAGEGALGLERALQAAGARSTVTTLWKVPDKATEVLMVRFYQNLWDKKMTKLEALREAQLWMLKDGAANPALIRGAKADDPDGTPVPKGGRLPPYYWAAFALAGDWR